MPLNEALKEDDVVRRLRSFAQGMEDGGLPRNEMLHEAATLITKLLQDRRECVEAIKPFATADVLGGSSDNSWTKDGTTTWTVRTKQPLGAAFADAARAYAKMKETM